MVVINNTDTSSKVSMEIWKGNFWH